MSKEEVVYFFHRLGEDIVLLALLSLPLWRRRK